MPLDTIQKIIEPIKITIEKAPAKGWLETLDATAVFTILAPVLVFLFILYREESKNFANLILKRTSFLDLLKRIGTASLTDLKCAEENLRFAKEIYIDNVGGMIPSINVGALELYETLDVQNFCAVEIVLKKNKHQPVFENNTLKLSSSDAPIINFNKTDLPTMMKDIENLYISTDNIKQIYIFRKEELSKIDMRVREYQQKLYMLVLELVHIGEFYSNPKNNECTDIGKKISQIFYEQKNSLNNLPNKRAATSKIYDEFYKPILNQLKDILSEEEFNKRLKLKEYETICNNIDSLLNEYFIYKATLEAQFINDISIYKHHIQVLNDFIFKQLRFYVKAKWFLFIGYPKSAA